MSALVDCSKVSAGKGVNERMDFFQMSNVSFERLKNAGLGTQWAMPSGSIGAMSSTFFNAYIPTSRIVFRGTKASMRCGVRDSHCCFLTHLIRMSKLTFGLRTTQTAASTIGNLAILLTRGSLQPSVL